MVLFIEKVLIYIYPVRQSYLKHIGRRERNVDVVLRHIAGFNSQVEIFNAVKENIFLGGSLLGW